MKVPTQSKDGRASQQESDSHESEYGVLRKSKGNHEELDARTQRSSFVLQSMGYQFNATSESLTLLG